MTLDGAKREVAEASRILAHEGILDAFGHVSCRHPERSDRFLISRSLAPALVRPEDVVELDLAGELTDTAPARLFLERFIHGEIYRQRPDVAAVVHSHAIAVLPFAVVPSVPIRPIFHMCGFLEGVPPPFDVADHAGPATDLLISSSALARALANHLGSASMVLMRGHGYTVVGDSVPAATYRAVYAARNCEVQAAALRLGEPSYLSSAESRACETTISGQMGRAWELWRQAIAAGLEEHVS